MKAVISGKISRFIKYQVNPHSWLHFYYYYSYLNLVVKVRYLMYCLPSLNMLRELTKNISNCFLLFKFWNQNKWNAIHSEMFHFSTELAEIYNHDITFYNYFSALRLLLSLLKSINLSFYHCFQTLEHCHCKERGKCGSLLVSQPQKARWRVFFQL